MDHLFLGHWRDVVLQRRELLDVLGRQEVRARRQNLPKLRVGRAEFLERGPQSLGLPASAGRTLLVGPSEQFPQPMFAHHRRDLRAPCHQPRLGGRGLRASDHGRRFPRCTIADRGGVHDDHNTAGVVADVVGDVAEQEFLPTCHSRVADHEDVDRLPLSGANDSHRRIVIDDEQRATALPGELPGIAGELLAGGDRSGVFGGSILGGGRAVR